MVLLTNNAKLIYFTLWFLFLSPIARLKLIFSGHIIKKDENLRDQGVKSSSRIMAIALNDEAHEVEVRKYFNSPARHIKYLLSF